jgi:hypothetical protein
MGSFMTRSLAAAIALAALGVSALSSARAGVIYDDTAGAAITAGSSPSYESPSYSGYSPAQEFVATGSGAVDQITFLFSNTGDPEPLTVSLWSTNAANVAFNTELGSWNFTSAVGANPFLQSVDISGGPALLGGVQYGIELASQPGPDTGSTSWVANANAIVDNYAVCNIAFFCNDPYGQTPTLYGSAGPQYLYAIDGAQAVAAVPEPAAWAVLLLGFGMTGAGLRLAGKRLLAMA